MAVDTETTGLNCMQNEIIEVGAVRFRSWEPVAEFNTLIRPRCHIPYNITCLTGISDAMVAGKPRFAEIIDDLMSFIGDDDIVGHNVCFDLGFLSHGGAPVYIRAEISRWIPCAWQGVCSKRARMWKTTVSAPCAGTTAL